MAFRIVSAAKLSWREALRKKQPFASLGTCLPIEIIGNASNKPAGKIAEASGLPLLAA
jgi:hypothetical protein